MITICSCSSCTNVIVLDNTATGKAMSSTSIYYTPDSDDDFDEEDPDDDLNI
jgi:hypothetical protein